MTRASLTEATAVLESNREGARATYRALLVAVDAFPPAPFDVEVTGWVPTIQLSACVRARPADGPVIVRHRAQVIAQGRVDETTTVWDRNGTVVAQATQIAGIRLGSPS